MKKAVSTTLTAGVLAVSMLLTPFSALAAGGSIDLDAERAIPSAPQLGFADTEDTEYVEGAVLHYVDFSKVKSLEEIGYYVAPNATNANTTMELTDDGLYVKATDQKVNITPFGASVPRNIKDYTLEMTVKFDNPNGKHLVFNPAESATGTGAVNGDIALRPVGQKDENWVNQRLWFHDKGQLMNDSSADDAAAIKQAVANGEFVTFSISVRNLSVVGVKVSGTGKTIYLQGNTAKGVLGSNWGLTVGNGNDELHLKSVKMIAGYNLDAEQKWPAGYVENENLLSVPSSALANGSENPDPIDPDPTPDTSDLTIASYNLRLGGMLYGYDMKALAKDLKKSGAQIIGLEEVYKNAPINNNQDTMRILGEELGYYYYYAGYEEREGGEYGVGILSKYPITEAKLHELPHNNSTNSRYGAAEATIDINGTKFVFVALHMDQNKAAESFSILREQLDGKDPYVIAGDFNYSNFEAMQAAFPDCTLANHGTVTTADGYMFDNMIFSPSVEMQDFIVTNTKNSDHYMISCPIVIKTPPVETIMKVETTDLTSDSISDALKALGYNTPEAVESKLKSETATKLDTDTMKVYDVTLTVSTDGGASWQPAASENIPEGIEVLFALPEGTTAEEYDFLISHLKENGTVELLTPQVKDGKLAVTVHSLSPFGVGWKAKSQPAPAPTNPPTTAPTEPPKQTPGTTAAPSGGNTNSSNGSSSSTPAPTQAPTAAATPAPTAKPATTSIPQTGDTGLPILPLIIVCIVSLTMTAILFVYRKKKD